MGLFSERHGYKTVRSIVQVDTMDKDLRVGLWNALDIYYLTRTGSGWLKDHKELFALFIKLWLDYFKHQLDELPKPLDTAKEQLREYFFSCKWFEVYDIIEIIANSYELQGTNDVFMNYCNTIMEREMSAYRFVGGRISRITSEEEITEIEQALDVTKALRPVSIHLDTALALLSDRKNPDYRKSIKESISAVEAISRIITRDDTATLGDALKIITNKIKLHPALQQAFNKLYGYTSDEGGIRHSLLSESSLDFEDAKYMLVSCSAFVNYLKLKASKAGIELEPK